MLREHPEMFSDANKKLIANSRAPVVDDKWIKYNPNHASYKGGTLTHHHLEQGWEATGIPTKVHQKWHGTLHPER
jgi:hypothetical protein